ncbi:MAG: conjugal transfer protein TraF [Acidiferrobacterales bacterium]|nr:conjugal transfer protein TraF [Acidiferrobacterales bacterium]
MYLNPLRKLNHSAAALCSSIVIFVTLFCPKALAVDLLNYQLKELNGIESHHLERYRGDTVLMVFFQPDCSFCVKQSKVLNQIQEKCADFQVIGVGVNGSRNDLQVELRAMRANYPAYQISPALQAEVGKVVGTPLMLIANKNGQFTQHLQGYQQIDVLTPELENAGLKCS